MFVRSLSLLSLVTFTIANGLDGGNALQDAFDAMDDIFDNIRGALSVFSTNVGVPYATVHRNARLPPTLSLYVYSRPLWTA